MRGGPDGCRRIAHDLLAGDAIDLDDFLDLVAEELEMQHVVHIRREHVDAVTAHPEGTAFELVIVAVVLHVDEAVDELVAVKRDVTVDEDRHLGVVFRRANAVYAAHGCDDDDVLACEQRRGGGMAHLLDFLVDRGVLLDVGIGLGNVRLGLVIVVVAHEIIDGVVGKELPELACELGGKRLVGSEHERGHLQALDDLGHGKGLARARNAEKRLVTHAVLDAAHEPIDCLRLVARKLVGGHALEGVSLLASAVDAGTLRAVHV